MLLHQVSNDFRIGLGGDRILFFNKLFLQREVVLDNAVVHHYHLAGAIAVRMCILFCRTPVRCPAGVTDAVGAIERLEPDGLFQVAQLALGTAYLQAAAVARHSDSGRVIAAIFQPPEAVNNHGNHPLIAYVSDDATHLLINPSELKCLPSASSNLAGEQLSISIHWMQKRPRFMPRL